MNDWSDNAAIVAESTLSHGEVQAHSAAIRSRLRDSGVQPGDLVAVASANNVGFYCCFAACYAAGNPVVALDPGTSPEELHRLLKHSSSAALIADSDIIAALKADASSLPEHVFHTPEMLALDSQREVTSENEGNSIAGDDSAYVLYTSGSTAAPKAAVISRAALESHVATLAKVFDYDPNARLLTYLPTYHADGMVHGVVASLQTGMTVVMPGAFGLTTDLEAHLRTHRITHFLCVPAILSMISRFYADQPELFQLESFKHLISTAGLLSPELWERVSDQFNVRVSNFYGMTESVSGSLYCGPGDDTYRLGTLGKPVDADVRIVGADGIPVGDSTVGELQIAGRHLMSGYLNDPATTQLTIVDDWLRTGDRFSRDADGFYHFNGRAKNIIKRGGVSVHPEDIVVELQRTPGVVDAEVIGVDDETFEQIIVAFVVLEDDSSVADIRVAVNERLSAERRPDRFVQLASLPRNDVGKIKLESLHTKLQEHSTNAADTTLDVLSRVVSIAAELFDTDPSKLNEQSSPETVDNWDSYAGMEFVIALESGFEIRLGARDVMRIDSIAAAVEVIERAQRRTGSSS